MVTKGTVFLKGLLYKAGFGNLVVPVQKFKPRFPEGLAAHIGEGLSFTEHFPPSDDISLKIKGMPLFGKTIAICNV
jgi:hypothetical protein